MKQLSLLITQTQPRVSVNIANQLTSATQIFQFPPAAPKYWWDSNPSHRTCRTGSQEQATRNSQLVQIVANQPGTVTFQIDNITGDRTIKFPDSDATLLSTDNVTLEDVRFGAGIDAENPRRSS